MLVVSRFAKSSSLTGYITDNGDDARGSVVVENKQNEALRHRLQNRQETSATSRRNLRIVLSPHVISHAAEFLPLFGYLENIQLDLKFDNDIKTRQPR